MKQLLALFLPAIINISCTSSGEKTNSNSLKEDSVTNVKIVTAADYFTPVGDSMELPSFEIEIQLSEKAKKQLKKKKETVIVAAYLSGIPKDTTLYMEDGEYAIGAHNIELVDSENAKFTGLKISKAIFESLADKDIQVLINVFSGRRSSNLNLLDCDILQKQISELKDQRFQLKGKLIGEK